MSRGARSVARRRPIVVGVVVLAMSSIALPARAQDVPEDTTTTSSTVPEVTTTTTTTISSTSTTLPPEGATTTTTDPDDETGPDVANYDPTALAELLGGYDEAVAMEADLLAQFELSVGQLDSLNQTMVGLSASISEVESELLDAETALSAAEDRADLAQHRLEDVEERLVDAQHLLEQQAVDAYINGGSSPTFAALLSAETAQDLDALQTYAEIVSEFENGAIDEYTALRLQAEALGREAAQAVGDAGDARDRVEAHHEELEAEREQQARAQADAFVAALAQQDLIAQVQSQRGSYEERLRTLTGTSDSIEDVLKVAQEGQELPSETDGIFLPPLQDPVVASPFGPRLHPIFGTIRMHNGVDLDAQAGRPIRAAADGEVAVAGWQNGYGFTVVIDHGNGLATLYAHQSSVVVAEGERVDMGDTIGLVGSTGWSTGPHLHWEVRVFGNPTQPIDFMGGESLLDERNQRTDSSRAD